MKTDEHQIDSPGDLGVRVVNSISPDTVFNDIVLCLEMPYQGCMAFTLCAYQGGGVSLTRVGDLHPGRVVWRA